MNIPIEKRIDIERQIVTCIVETAILKGYLVSVYDGEAYPIKKSTDKAAIVKELFACDEEYLIIRDQHSGKIGTIDLIYGNDGWDVISNYSWVEEGAKNTEKLMKELIDEGTVEALVSKLEKEWS